MVIRSLRSLRSVGMTMWRRSVGMTAIVAAMVVGCVGQIDDEPLDDEDPATIVDPAGDDSAPGLVLDFTATWCVNCPRMATAIEEASRERPGKIFPVSIHFRDDFSYAAGEALAKDYGVSAYPSVVVNLDPATLITATSKDLILAKLDATASGRKAPCTLTGSVSGSFLTLSVTAAEAGSYRLGALLLEDGLIAPQTGGTDDYVHDNILRAILSASVAGDDLGDLSAGASENKTYSLEITPGSTYHIVAYVIEGGSGKVNTVASFPLK